MLRKSCGINERACNNYLSFSDLFLSLSLLPIPSPSWSLFLPAEDLNESVLSHSLNWKWTFILYYPFG